MMITLKKYKEKFLELLQPKKGNVNLSFGCHNITIDEKNYLMCRAIVPDLDEMLAVQSEVYDGDHPWSYEDFEKQVQDKMTTLYIVMRYEDQMVAYAGCRFDYAPGEAHVTNIAVIPEFQQHGLGLKMLETLKDEAQKYGCKKMSLDVKKSDHNAQALYKKAGFHENKLKKAYYKNEDGLELSCRLGNKNIKKKVEKGWKKLGI